MADNNPTCIFCGALSSGGSREHLLPASLGGGDNEVLPAGLVCSSCNQYFGSKVERYALDCFPFNIMRVMESIATRKGKPSRLGTNLGVLSSTDKPGRLRHDPVKDVQPAAVMGSSQLLVSTHPKYPNELCRLLVKIGLELLACDSPTSARSSRYDAARTVARRPGRGTTWSYAVVHRNPQKEAPEARIPVCVELSETNGGLFFALRYYSVMLVTPLEPHDFDAGSGDHEPEILMYQVTF